MPKERHVGCYLVSQIVPAHVGMSPNLFGKFLLTGNGKINKILDGGSNCTWLNYQMG